MSKGVKLKADEVKRLVKELESAKVVCVISLEGLPSNQFRGIRSFINGQVIIKPKNVIKRALMSLPKLAPLVDFLKGSCALFLSSDDVFKTAIKLAKLREPAFIKAGAIAPFDIPLEAGPTPFMPGPMMTLLTSLGVKVNAKGGKLTITDPAVIAKKDEPVSVDAANVLFQMKIAPLTTGLDLLGAFDGVVFSGAQLFVDVGKLMSDLVLGRSNALNLSFNACIINSLTIELLLSKAFNEAKNLAREAGIITSDNIGEVMLTAKAKALALASSINWEVGK